MIADIPGWQRYSRWLARKHPKLAASLLPGVPDKVLDAYEKQVGFALPGVLRAFWKACGGQRDLDGPGAMGEFVLLAPADSLAEWQNWKKLRDESTEDALEALAVSARSYPEDAVHEEYTWPGWIPLWKEPLEGNYLGIDLDPGPAGAVGQVINFGRDEDHKHVFFWDYAAVFEWMADEADRGALVFENEIFQHRDGRILGALVSRARSEKLPAGQKPSTKASKRKPAAKKKPAQSLVKSTPEPTSEELPQPAQAAFDAFVGQLVKILRTKAKKLPQGEAYCHQELDDPRKPLESSLIGPSLSMVPYRPPIDYDDEFLETVRKIFQVSLENGLTLAQFEVRFRREAAGWKSEPAFETAANRKALIGARKAIDEEIREALIEFVGSAHSDWKRVTLDFDARSDAPRSGLKVVLVHPRPIRSLEPSAELRALFDRVQALHSRFGRKLHSANWGVESDRPQKLSTRFYYG
jgi:cell wall assembly regulator SMI1